MERLENVPALDFTDQASESPPLDFSSQSKEDPPDFSSQARNEPPDFSSQALAEPPKRGAYFQESEPEPALTADPNSLSKFMAAKLISIPKPDTTGVKEGTFNAVEKAAVGLTRSVLGGVESLFTPLTATVAAASAIPVVGKPLAIAAGAGFGAHTAITGAMQFSEAVQRGDVQGAAEAAGNMILGYGMTGLGLKQTLKGEVPVVTTKLAPVSAQEFSKTTGPTETFPPSVDVYHGTSGELTGPPDVTKAGLTSGIKNEPAFWVTSDEASAKGFAEMTVMDRGGAAAVHKFQMDASNPLTVEVSVKDITGDFNKLKSDAIQKAIAQGNDAVIFKTPKTVADEIAVLDPSILKTAPKETVAETPIPTADEAQRLGISATAHPAIRAIADLFNPEGVSRAVGTVKDYFAGLAGKSMPKITRADAATGELGVRMAASRAAAEPLADVFVSEAIGDSGVDPKKLGTALTEDNLRSVAKGFEDAGEPDKAAAVHSVIGSRGSPFATEADYQAFLADPATQAAIERYKQLWDAQVEPMYKRAQDIDPDEELPSRGLQTGARVNLLAIMEGGEPTASGNIVQGIGRGNLLGTLKKKSPFGIQAKGTGQSYNGNITDMMRNTFGRQFEIANKNAFDKALVESGNAIIDKPGQHPILKDETTVAFPYKRQRVVVTSREPPPTVTSQNQSIYLRKSLASEYSRASGTETRFTGGPIGRAITGLINKSALAGFTDATVHISNLATVLMTRPAVAGKWWQDAGLAVAGRADLVPIAARSISKAFQNNAKQIAELTEIGAMRQTYPRGSNFNPMSWLGDFIHIADKTTRLVMDDAFKDLVKEGLVENTETNRREWVNQVGQYNKRLQGKWVAAARDTGLSPFITAGRTFTTLGIRNVTLQPGAKTTGLAASAALKANIAAKWIGLGTLAGTLNYLLTHKKEGGGMMGRPGTPIGDVDSGMDDENGRPLVFPLSGLLGLGRGLRVTGIRGYVEAKRKGLPSRVAMDAAIRDIVNSQASTIAGPPIKFAVEAASGYPPAVEVGRAVPPVLPEESQHLANLKGAIVEANPILSSIAASQEPGASVLTGLQKQFPRLSLAPKQPPEMLEHYPEIVHKARVNEYIDGVIHKARTIAPAERIKYLETALKDLNQEDQAHAWQQFKRRRVLK